MPLHFQYCSHHQFKSRLTAKPERTVTKPLNAKYASPSRHLNGFVLLTIARAIARQLKADRSPTTAMRIKPGKPWIKILLIVLVAYFVLLPASIAIALAIHRQTRSEKFPPGTPVPQLVGMDLKAAEAKAREAKLVPKVLLERWDIDAPHGVVVGQEPEYGQSVAPGTMVGLELSVPDPNARAPGK